jgi:nitrite reductase/ring-hydroxylating ferredoxin subunit
MSNLDLDLDRREFVVGVSAIAGISAAACAFCACGADALAAEEEKSDTEKKEENKPIDIGIAADYKKDGIKDTWAKSKRFFVVRKDKKLYAPSAQCTHKKCALKLKNDEIACSCHGSKFADDGKPSKGPAKSPLPRYGISKDAQGKITVDKSKKFEEKKWDDAGAFVELT